jgi:methylmalonyl-CoA mutase N-terminal domain/subunit
MTDQFTRSKIPLKPVYTPEDIKNLDYEKNLGSPGDFPYTRGIRPAGAWTWIQRELSGEGDPKTSNKQLKHLIAQGQTGIDVIGDAPSMGLLDPDHPLAKNAVGTQGVSICCLQDFRDLWKDLPLDSITISNSLPAIFTAAALFLVAREHKIPAERLRGSVIQAPFFMEDCGYAVHMPFDLRLRMTSDSIAFCTKETPRFHAFLEDTYFFSEAGLNAVEEMALGFIEIRHVIRDLLKRGMDIDSFAPRIAILVNCSMDIFEEIAKIRATRRLFARMMKKEFGAKDRRSWAPVITCHTSGLSLTAQQPFNNIVRGAIQSLALVMAGVQALEISAFDEAYRTPSPESHLVGLRTQQIIGLETNATRVVDPLGGSYFLETLTDEIEKRIWDMVKDIESKGNPAELSDKGYFKKFFDDIMARYAKEIADGELPKVGLNCHQIPDEEDTLLKEVAETKIEPCWDHIERIKKYKKKRDPGKIKIVLQQCYQSARDEGENLTYPIIQAFEAGATIGEISGVMRMAYNYPYDPHGMVKPII